MRYTGPTLFLYVFILCCLLCRCTSKNPTANNPLGKKEEGEKVGFPNEFFFSQRAYPDDRFAYRAYEKGLKQSLDNRKFFATARRGSGSNWQLEGPANIGGRINTLAVNPLNHAVIYAGGSQGGVFKTTDNGNSWISIFDDQPFLAIGDIEIDPQHPDTLYVGTGDPNISGYPFIGDGIYKSTDGGQTWTNTGLADTRIVSEVVVHPANTNIVFAACMGLPFERNSDRGLYKSSNGGQSWNKILYLSDTTGVTDVLIHPTDTNIIYAAGWDRIRNNRQSLISGLGAKVYKTTNGGANWTMLTNGLPTDTLSRIGLAMDATNPNIIYAEIVDTSFELQGIYRTFDAGNSWSPIPIFGLEGILGGFGWYFGKIYLNPFNTSEIYVLGIDLWRTTDDGNFWEMVTPEWWQYEVHADKHDMVFLDANSFLLGTDGGAYRTDDGAFTWTDIENIPNTQFYHVGVNPHEPGVYWGGAQDNGTTRGNALSINFWERMYGGDGFRVKFHPTDPGVIYAETQDGGIVVAMDGINFMDAIDGIDPAERRNWDMPFIVSNHNPNVLYCGTHRIYKSDIGAYPYWTTTSNDLTDGIIYESRMHTISTIAESPANANILYAGTSDGNVWRTMDGGQNWQNITAGLPNRYVTDIKASQANSNVVFVSHSGYRDNDNIPHAHVSFNNGTTWLNISGNLPQLAVNQLEIYAGTDSTLFAATDGGVYYTTNMGGTWTLLGDNLPIVPVFDIEIDAVNQKLIAGTFARSIHSIEIDSLLTPFQIIANAGQDKEKCANESIFLTATGGTSYVWSPALGLSCTQCHNPIASPTVTTTYSVTASDAFGNTATDAVVVTVKATPQIPDISQQGDSVFTTAVATGYQWYVGGTLLDDETTTYLTPRISGYYRVVVTNSVGCTAASASLSVVVSGVDALASSDISVYPNPSTGIIYLDFDKAILTDDVELSVYNIIGEKTFSAGKLTSGNLLDLSHLESGSYLLELKAGTERAVKKILISR